MLKTLGLPWLVMIGLAAAVIFMAEPAQISLATRGNAIVGRASVVDGDTLDIRRTRIRLHGIDAPEREQLCKVHGRLSRCGQRAALALAGKIRGHAVACAPQGRDRYDRVVAVCRVGEENLNAWMVAEGWAMVYRRYSWAYLPKEMVARWKKVGIWEGDVIPPWEWRRGVKLESGHTTSSQLDAANSKQANGRNLTDGARPPPPAAGQTERPIVIRRALDA